MRVARRTRDAVTREYWAPDYETMGADAQRALEEERLRAQLVYTAHTSEFYREKWRAAGVDALGVGTVEDLAALPFTEKVELHETQAARPPLGANQSAPLEALVRMQATGGTSGRPLRMGMTRRDVQHYNEIGARAAWCAGMRPGDVLLECMNYSLYAGGVSDHMSFETLGACVAAVGVGQSKRLLEILKDIGIPVALWSTPSYALHLADVARAEGLEPRDLGIRKGFFSGDAGLAVPGFREQIEQTWGLVARDLWGMGEIGAPGAECREARGLHYLGQGLFVVELVDPHSGVRLPMAEGVVGELVFTTLEREAHPLIRFRTHDHVRVWVQPCACGRSGFRFRILGRGDDMFIVRGVNVYPQAVQDVIYGFQPHVSGEFQVLLEDAPPHARPPKLRVEASSQAPAAQLARLGEDLTTRIREVLVFTPEVEVLPFGSLPRTEKKSKRVYRIYLGDRP